MIAWLSGRVVQSGAGHVVIDVGGVGYRLLVTPSTLAELISRPSPVEVSVHTLVREDAITLFGFADDDERGVFEVLLGTHGVGPSLALAILGTLGAAGVIVQDRNAPDETGALAKAASGALEVVPWVRVVNLARALESIAEAGYWRLGLDGEGKAVFPSALPSGPVALVLGAEGEGLRHNVAQHCDSIARLPIASAIESLNVSNAAAIALYAVATREEK